LQHPVTTTKADYKAVRSPEAFERGKELAFSVCAGCHYDRAVNKFIGTQIHDVPGIAGKCTRPTSPTPNQMVLRHVIPMLRSGICSKPVWPATAGSFVHAAAQHG